MTTTYAAFLQEKAQAYGDGGFAPVWTPDWLMDFQQAIVEWSTRKGRSAILADCGLGKTPMQLVWNSSPATTDKRCATYKRPPPAGAPKTKRWRCRWTTARLTRPRNETL